MVLDAKRSSYAELAKCRYDQAGVAGARSCFAGGGGKKRQCWPRIAPLRETRAARCACCRRRSSEREREREREREHVARAALPLSRQCAVYTLCAYTATLRCLALAAAGAKGERRWLLRLVVALRRLGLRHAVAGAASGRMLSAAHRFFGRRASNTLASYQSVTHAPPPGRPRRTQGCRRKKRVLKKSLVISGQEDQRVLQAIYI